MTEDKHIFLVFDQPDAIVFDLYKILRINALQISPIGIDELKNATSEFLFRSTVSQIVFNYKETGQQQLQAAKLAVCVVTNGFAQSETCKGFISQAEKNKVPMVSLIVEDILDLDDLKFGLLRDSIAYFDVFKDRVYDTGYDQYMWIGEVFEDCINRILCTVGLVYKKYPYTEYLHYSYLLTDAESMRSVNAVMDTFNEIVHDYFTYSFIVRIGQKRPLPKVENFMDYCVPPVKSEQTFKDADENGFNYYEYMLRRGFNGKDVEYYVTVLRMFDRVVQSSVIFNDEERVNLADDRESDPEKCKSQTYSYIHKHIKENFKNVYVTADRITSVLEAEMNKHGIELQFVDKLLGFMYSQKHFLEHSRFYDRTMILFLLTKDYYSSKKFQKLYKEAKRVKKAILLVKLQEFEMNGEDSYDRLHIHDIHKHADCMFDGYLTRRLMTDVAKYCTLPVENYFCKIWLEVSIISIDCEFARELKNVFEKQNMRVKCNYEDEDEIMDSIEKARIVLFCLTNEYLRTERFQRDFAFAEQFPKKMLFLLMEEIVEPCQKLKVDLSSFSVIRMHENGCALRGQPFYRLCYFVYSILDSKQNRVAYRKNGEVELHAIDGEYEPCRYSLYRDGLSVKLGESVASKIKYKQKACKTLKVKAVTYIKHLDEYWFVTKGGIKCFNSEFKFTSNREEKRCLELITLLYDQKKCNFYYIEKSCLDYKMIEMYDRDFQYVERTVVYNKTITSFAVCNSQIFVSDAWKVIVYNFKLKEIHTYYNDAQPEEWSLIVEPRCDSYIYLFTERGEAASTFNVNSFTVNRDLALKRNAGFFKNDRFVANGFSFENNCKDSSVVVREIKYIDNPVGKSLGGFTCKLNPYPPHLLKHPYLLPCGSLACLECIYGNYNFFLKKFACAACNEEHVLTGQLTLSSLIDDNLRQISDIQNANLKKCLDEQWTIVNKLEYLGRGFEFLEEELEIRIESLKTDFEKYLESQHECINRLEKRMLSKRSVSKKKANKQEKNVFDKPGFVLSQCPYRKAHFAITDNETPYSNVAGDFCVSNL